jgi:hypothetical protein
MICEALKRASKFPWPQQGGGGSLSSGGGAKDLCRVANLINVRRGGSAMNFNPEVHNKCPLLSRSRQNDSARNEMNQKECDFWREIR